MKHIQSTDSNRVRVRIEAYLDKNLVEAAKRHRVDDKIARKPNSPVDLLLDILMSKAKITQADYWMKNIAKVQNPK